MNLASPVSLHLFGSDPLLCVKGTGTGTGSDSGLHLFILI